MQPSKLSKDVQMIVNKQPPEERKANTHTTKWCDFLLVFLASSFSLFCPNSLLSYRKIKTSLLYTFFLFIELSWNPWLSWHHEKFSKIIPSASFSITTRFFSIVYILEPLKTFKGLVPPRCSNLDLGD